MEWRETRTGMVRRVLGHLDRTPVAQFPLGPGATTGCVVSVERPLAVPLSGEPCVGYMIEVSWLNGAHWVPLLHEWDCAPFEIEDESGRARVATEGIDVAFCRTVRETAWSAEQVPPGGYGLLARHGHPYFHSPLFFEQSVLHLGDEVVVCGAGARVPMRGSSTMNYRAAPPTSLVIGRDDHFPLAVSNVPSVVRSDGDIPARRV